MIKTKTITTFFAIICLWTNISACSIPSRNSYEWIKNVKMGNIDNTTNRSLSGFDEYSDMSIGEDLTQDNIILVELTPGYKSKAYEEYWRIWIDVNQDNFFSDDEIVFQAKGKGVVSGSFQIPVGGNGLTQVKVAMNWRQYPTCDSHTFGEIEYYSAHLNSQTPLLSTFNLPITIPIVSVIDTVNDLEYFGFANNTTRKLTSEVSYTNGTGEFYEAFVGNYIVNNPNTGKNGDINSFRITYPQGNLYIDGGTIPITIEINGDEHFDAEQIPVGNQLNAVTLDMIVDEVIVGQIKVDIIGGVLDRNFEDNDHQFIYFPVEDPNGRLWINNKLGANYSNTQHPSFNPLQQPKNPLDFNAYGSLFQWGRYSDGHELMIHEEFESTPANDTIIADSYNSQPAHSRFIVPVPGSNSGLINYNDWQGENGVNNPCPKGYQLPTLADYLSVPITFFNFSNSGHRDHSNGDYSPLGETAWTMDYSGDPDLAVPIMVGENLTTSDYTDPRHGYSIRCIKSL